MIKLAKWLQLDLFEKASSREAVEISPQPVELKFGRRFSQSWSVTWKKGQACQLRLPGICQDAPQAILDAFLEWVDLAVFKRRTQTHKARKKTLEAEIRDYLAMAAGAPEQVRLSEKTARRRLQTYRTQGKFHDLRQAFDRVNREYFEGKLQAQITWSSRLGGLSTHCKRPHPDGGQYDLITISRGYDAADATAEILDGVVYHECLHIVYPPRVKNGRRIVHGKEFRLAEARYQHYDAWMHWHRHGLPKSLRKLSAR